MSDNNDWADKVLDLELPENDAGAETVREYLKTLLFMVLTEEEGFSGKRPFGNSGWIFELQVPIDESNLVPDEIARDEMWDILVEAI